MNLKLVLLVILVLYSILVAVFSQSAPAGSSFSAEPNGTSALFKLFNLHSFSVERWFQPFDELESKAHQIQPNSQQPGIKGEAMIVVSPLQFARSEILLNWVKKGNRLVYFDDAKTPFSSILSSLGLEREAALGDFSSIFSFKDQSLPVRCPKLRELSWCRNIKNISHLVSALSFPKQDSLDGEVEQKKESSESLISENLNIISSFEDSIYILSYSHGAGEVLLFSGNTAILNKNIDKFDNLKILYQFLSTSSKIYFDEFHHGYRMLLKGQQKSKMALVWLFVAGLFFWLLAGVLSRSVRFGVPVQSRTESDSANLEFVQASGTLYYQHKTASAFLDYINLWKKRVSARTGISAYLGDEQFIQKLADFHELESNRTESIRQALAVLRNAEDGDRLDFDTEIINLEMFCQKNVKNKRNGSKATGA